MGIMTLEWSQLCNGGQIRASGYIGTLVVVAGTLMSLWGGVLPSVILLVIGAVITWLVVRRDFDERVAPAAWSVAAIIFVGIAGVGFIWLREIDGSGFELLLWLLLTVWVTDTFAYFVGRAIGGPKLAPTISPNKTWSGLVGGAIAAAIWSGFWSYITDIGTIFDLVAIGAGTAVFAQLGDLSVSVVKRRFGAKDSGNLIPGHGGFLDRMDGFLGAVPVVSLSIAVAKGDFSLWS
tara:strand:+ start:53640 stop:54344 length:705 start_codon:yes stop_codon:yes gene_type:complete